MSLDMTTLTIMRQLPREVDPLVFNMSMEDPGDVTYSSVGGLSEQIRELREVGVVWMRWCGLDEVGVAEVDPSPGDVTYLGCH